MDGIGINAGSLSLGPAAGPLLTALPLHALALVRRWP